MSSRNAVIKEINDLFEAGKRTAEDDFENGTHTECPEQHGSLWWKRGYSYAWRLFRAIDAEARLREMKRDNRTPA